MFLLSHSGLAPADGRMLWQKLQGGGGYESESDLYFWLMAEVFVEYLK